MNSKYQELRNKYSTFRYNSFEITRDGNSLNITYDFEIEGLTKFFPKWVFNISNNVDILNKQELIEKIVFNLGMVEVVSYLKCVCPKKLIVKAGSLTDEQKKFWKKLYVNGLGEFFFVNDIVEEMNTDTFLEIESKNDKELPINITEKLIGNLIPIGGGKDSLVTLDILKEQKNTNMCYIVNQRGATRDSAKEAGYSEKNIYEAKRYIDGKLLELNTEGFLNGHTPFSAILAFSSYLTAILENKKYIVLSNEASANESNVEGTNINHQYSKSIEFEKDFREYINKYVCDNGPEYFSLLRPLSEWQIVKAFSKLDQYFEVFKSCNVGSKQDAWCENCPKCVYVYIMLKAFLTKQDMNKIFKTDLLNEEKHRQIFAGLIYPDETKPFECVGTKKEINLSLNMIMRQYREKGEEVPALLKGYNSEIKDLDKEIQKEMISWNTVNYLPKEFESILRQYMGINGIKEKIAQELYNKKILILGYGREGKSTYSFIKNKVNYIKLGIADLNNIAEEDKLKEEDIELHIGKDYLEALNSYDVIIKTPGIALNNISDEVKEKITSQTDLFIKYGRDKVIGITGTKGKSTTSSLTYHILKTAKKRVELIGNIGIPAFNILDKEVDTDYFVYELSAHQLEYLHKSPKIAVVLNLFEEHLDHFNTIEKYHGAKLNIFKYQEKSDYCIGNKEVLAKTDNIDVKKIEVLGDCKKDNTTCINNNVITSNVDERKLVIEFPKDSHIIGEHNIYNSMFAVTIANILKIEKEAVKEALETFEMLSHRLQNLGVYNGIQYIDDSISTIPEATIKAIETFKKTYTVIIGGMDRGINYDILIDYINSHNTLNYILIYESGKRIYDNIKQTENVRYVYDLEEAVKIAKMTTPKGNICMLSPAAASYGHFKNFEERGEKFREYIMEKNIISKK